MKSRLIGASLLLLLASCGPAQVQDGLIVTVCVEVGGERSCDFEDELFQALSSEEELGVWTFDGVFVSEENGRFTLEGDGVDLDVRVSSQGEWNPDLLTTDVPSEDMTVRVSSFFTGAWASGLTVEVIRRGDPGFAVWAVQVVGPPSQLHDSLIQRSPALAGANFSCASTSYSHTLGSTDDSTEIGTNSSGTLLVGTEEISVQHFHSRSGSRSSVCEDGDVPTSSSFVARKTRSSL